MANANEVVQWFIFHNPELASGYIDENTKVNKLLYFSNLMNYCVHNRNLIEDEFVAFPNGPVVYSVYRDYRYNGLSALPQKSPALNAEDKKIVDIVNFVYGHFSANQLVAESHSHSLWNDVKHLIPNNPRIDFDKTDEKLVFYYRSLFQTYRSLDFSDISKEKINGNLYYYYKDSFEMTDEIVERLSLVQQQEEPKFLEIINGELVIS